MTNAIKVEDIIKIYNIGNDIKVKALNNANLTVEEGEFLGIYGPSGSGKTTLLNLIGGLDKPTSGNITVLGNRLDTMDDRRLSKMRLMDIGYIFQEHNLLPPLTVSENLELPMILAKKIPNQRKERVTELLSIVDLEDLIDRLPGEISRGQRQRIAALRALANKPKLILGDEPTSDLDSGNAKRLMSFLKEVNKTEGTTIILATTDPEILRGYTTRESKLIDGIIR